MRYSLRVRLRDAVGDAVNEALGDAEAAERETDGEGRTVRVDVVEMDAPSAGPESTTDTLVASTS